jgi:hypothetical protein
VLGFVLFLFGVVLLPIEVIYAQSELNRVWRADAARAGTLAPAA